MDKKNLIINLIILAITFIVILIIIEILLRTIFPVSDNLFIGDEIIGHKHIPNKNAIYVSKEYKTKLQFNEEGFRDINHNIENLESKTRIIFLGDSFVDALEVDFENTFQQKLREKLNKEQENYEMFNFGMWYFSTAQEYLTYKIYAEKYSPDVAYLFVFYNDPYETCLQQDTNPTYYIENNQVKERDFEPLKVGKLKLFISKYCKLAVLIRKTYQDWKTKTQQEKTEQEAGIQQEKKVFLKEYDEQTEECWKLTSYFLKQLKQETDKTNTKLITIIIPHPLTIYEQEKQTFLESTNFSEKDFSFNKPDKEFEKILNELGIQFVNLREEIEKQGQRGQRIYYEIDGHFNEKGHELVAKILYENLINKRTF